jgi:peptidoglycan/xylan/chitin deacetylase (PgdA/CDA1 family)
VKYLYNPPLIIKKFFPDFCWKTTNDKILLTFDDGPNPGTTEKILKTLDEIKIKALFFCVGNNNKLHPSSTKTILGEGHHIGNHTFNHKLITKISFQESLDEILNFNSLLKNEHNYSVIYFRPPHGKINLLSKKIIKESGMKCVMWNLLTYDYQNDFDKVKYSVDNYLKKDSIIVLHDSDKSKDIIADSIRYIYDTAAKNGFQFGEPEECLN